MTERELEDDLNELSRDYSKLEWISVILWSIVLVLLGLFYALIFLALFNILFGR